MSWDVELRPDPCPLCGAKRDRDDDAYYEGNFTYNYSPAWAALGLPRWPEINGRLGSEMIQPLVKALSELEAQPEKYYGAMILGGGTWGTAQTLRKAIESFLEACCKHPDARLRASG